MSRYWCSTTRVAVVSRTEPQQPYRLRPPQPAITRAQSNSGSPAVTGIKVKDVPGAGFAEGDMDWRKGMFVLETTTRFARPPEA